MQTSPLVVEGTGARCLTGCVSETMVLRHQSNCKIVCLAMHLF